MNEKMRNGKRNENEEGREILRTDRLILREMAKGDFPALCKILQDGEVMYAYAHAFSDDEAKAWLENQFKRYRTYGTGLWAVVLKETGEMVGQCGLTRQPVPEEIDPSGEVLEIGYLFQKAFWHRGYASEAAAACREYAFKKLNSPRVYSIIRDNNIASQNVAGRNGMGLVGQFVKHYYGIDMPHLVFAAVNREDIKMEEIKSVSASSPIFPVRT